MNKTPNIPATKSVGPAPTPPPSARGFRLQPVADIDGRPTNTFSDMWDWHYSIDTAIEDPREIVLAEEISRAAAMVREFYAGGPKQQEAVAEADKKASLEIMTKLKNLFAAVLVQGQSVDHDWAKDSVQQIRADFIRRVIEPRHHRNLIQPVSRAVMWMVVTILLAFLSLAFADDLTTDMINALKMVFPDDTAFGALPGTALIVIAGTFMGRLLFFAIAFSEKLQSIEHYISIQRFTGETASLSLVFDALTGFAAFLLFQTNLIVLTVGGGEADGSNGDAGNAVLSTQNIDDNWLIAFGFGILIGISRAAFLSRVGDLSKKSVGPANA